MESAEIEQLLDKYFAGITTIEEEQTLNAFFADADHFGDFQDVRPLFQYLESAKKEQPAYPFHQNKLRQPEKKALTTRKVFAINWFVWPIGMAACFFMLSILLQYRHETGKPIKMTEQISKINKTESDALAVAETEKALMRISLNLNKAESNIVKISKFTQTKDLITSKK